MRTNDWPVHKTQLRATGSYQSWRTKCFFRKFSLAANGNLDWHKRDQSKAQTSELTHERVQEGWARLSRWESRKKVIGQ